MPPSGFALKPHNSKTSWKKLEKNFPHFGDYLLPNLTLSMTSSFLMDKSMLQKYKKLKNGPNFDRLERPPKINIFQKKFTHRIFLVIETLLCPGSKVLKN